MFSVEFTPYIKPTPIVYSTSFSFTDNKCRGLFCLSAPASPLFLRKKERKKFYSQYLPHLHSTLYTQVSCYLKLHGVTVTQVEHTTRARHAEAVDGKALPGPAASGLGRAWP